MKLQLKLTEEQKKLIDKQLLVSNYVYNKTIKYINDNKITKINDKELRNKLVTKNSKTENVIYKKFKNYITNIKKQTNTLNKRNLKDVIKLYYLNQRIKFNEELFKDFKKNIKPTENKNLFDWELEVDKEIRAGAVFEACKNIKTAKMNVLKGNIKFFKMKFKSKKNGKYSMVLTQSMFKLKNINNSNFLYFTSNKMKDKQMYFSKRNQQKINSITNLKDSKIIKNQGKYFLALSVDNVHIQSKNQLRLIGIDPGVRTFLSCYSEDNMLEYHFNNNLTDNLDKLKSKLKNKERRKLKRVRKKILTKIEKRKDNIINELHWKCINHLIKNYDYIFLEKFESQGFIKGGKNKTLNRMCNNLKHFQFRERLMYKADCHDKKVILVNAYLTTKTCSNCGNIQDIGNSKIYNCDQCKKILSRDLNAAKNILMKGLLR